MKRTIICVSILVLMAVIAAVSQTASTPKHHSVFQLTEREGEDWGRLVGHVNNLRNAFEKDGEVQVEVVFFGPGIEMLKKTNTAYEERLKQLAGKGVVLAACRNAMRFYGIKSEDLFPFASEVDSGVAELTRKQEAGWAYIH